MAVDEDQNAEQQAEPTIGQQITQANAKLQEWQAKAVELEGEKCSWLQSAVALGIVETKKEMQLHWRDNLNNECGQVIFHLTFKQRSMLK